MLINKIFFVSHYYGKNWFRPLCLYYSFQFAFLIFDHAGNYVGSGLNTPNVITVNFPVTHESTSSGSTTTSDTTTTTTTSSETITQDTEESNGDSSPIFWLTILFGFSTIQYLRRKK